MAKNTKDFVSRLLALGLTQRVVARRVGCSERTVRYHVNRLRYAKSKVRKSHPQKRQLHVLITKKKKGEGGKVTFPYGSCRRAAQELKRTSGVSLSKSTVWRILTETRSARVRQFVPSKNPLDHKRRVIFSKLYVHMDPATFCFVDESYINVNEGVGRFQWVLPGEPVEPRERVRWPVKILIFAAIAVGFRFLVVIVLDAKKDQKLDSRKYKLRCLSPLVPHLLSRNLTLVQDGASHTRRRRFRNTWLEKACNKYKIGHRALRASIQLRNYFPFLSGESRRTCQQHTMVLCARSEHSLTC